MRESNLLIGRDYERYVGYKYEHESWEVIYRGNLSGYGDVGRDLVCSYRNWVHIVQCKCWANEKEIGREALERLHRSTEAYVRAAQPPNQLSLKFSCTTKISIRAAIVTSTRLSSSAMSFAREHNIHVREHFYLDKSYPKIKCPRSQKENVYYKPSDYSYDSIRMRISNGDFYVKTSGEAAASGFTPHTSCALFARTDTGADVQSNPMTDWSQRGVTPSTPINIEPEFSTGRTMPTHHQQIGDEEAGMDLKYLFSLQIK